jgi:hypothetical protein
VPLVKRDLSLNRDSLEREFYSLNREQTPSGDMREVLTYEGGVDI